MNARPHTTPLAAKNRVFLKYSSPNNRPTKATLAALLYRTLQITLTALVQTASGFVCETDYTQDIDRIYAATEKLKALNLYISAPNAITAKRTVLVRQLDPEIGSMSADE